MNRVVIGMAVMNYLLVAANSFFGFVSRYADGPSKIFGQDPFIHHFILGIVTGLFTILTHCIVFTYFLGTTRWVRETTSAYELPESLRQQSRRCRSRAMAVAMPGMLLVVFTIAAGAGSHTKVWPHYVHQLSVAVTYAFMLFAFRHEHQAVEEHTAITDLVMEEVNRIRRERGLPLD